MFRERWGGGLCFGLRDRNVGSVPSSFSDPVHDPKKSYNLLKPSVSPLKQPPLASLGKLDD